MGFRDENVKQTGHHESIGRIKPFRFVFNKSSCLLIAAFEVRKSWQKVSKTAIGRTIYQHMSTKCAEVDALFVDDLSAVARHERYFVELIQSAVDNLTDAEGALRPWLETIGEGHTGFAIKYVFHRNSDVHFLSAPAPALNIRKCSNLKESIIRIDYML